MPSADLLTPDFIPSRDLYPFESRWYESSRGPIHYVDEGSGPVLVMLHGNPTWSFLYRGIITRLRDRFRCIAPDYPGFGLSVRPAGYGYTPAEHADVVAELLTALQPEELVIVGHDWGGPIGMAIAVGQPDRVRGLVMGNTWCWPMDHLRHRVFSRVMSTYVLQRAILQSNFFVERLIPMGTARKLTAGEMEHYRRVQPEAGQRVGAAVLPHQLVGAGAWLAAIDAHVQAQLGDKPLLLTWGMRDPAFRPRHFIPGWRRRFRDVELVELPDAKHYIQEDAPQEIAAAITSRFG